MKEEMLGGRDGEGCGMDGGGGGTVAVHIAKELPAGLHLYEKITGSLSLSISIYPVLCPDGRPKAKIHTVTACSIMSTTSTYPGS